MLLKLGDQLGWSRDFAVFTSLRVESEFRLCANSDRLQLHVYVGPQQVHHFLFPETGHQKSGEQGTLRIETNRKEACQILMPVVPRKRGDALGQLQLTRDPARAVALEKLRDDVVLPCFFSDRLRDEG